MKFPGTKLISFLLSTLLVFVFTSCQKDNAEQNKSIPESINSLSADETSFEEIANEALQDVEGVLGYSPGASKSTDRLPCNAVVDSTAVQNDTITIFITYNGLSCNGRFFRTGQVEVRKRVGTRWGMQGASVNVRFINLSVTIVRIGQTFLLNSNKTFTNITGGFIPMLGNNGFNSLIHKTEGWASINFENATTRIWNLACLRTFTGTRNELVLTVKGFGVQDGYNNLAYWGTNRNDEEFFTQYDQDIVFKSACNWNPVSGVKIHQIPAASKSAIVTFGYNSDNQIVTGDECPTHFKLDWVNGSNSGTRFLPLR